MVVMNLQSLTVMISTTDISENRISNPLMTIFCFISKIALEKKIEVSFAAPYVVFPCLRPNEEMFYG